MYKRILVANRGEIALRIIRACREMGIETVAIFSEADRGSAYLELADEAICVGPARSAESYLKIAHVISAAEVGNVEAIHPGYGFLAENAHFNEICRSCKIDFIGPTPEAMERWATRTRPASWPATPSARRARQRGLIEDEAEAVRTAHEIGFPVLIKATAGGGGKGMRVAANDLALKSALQQARTEAEAAFGNAGRLPGKIRRAPAARRSADPGRSSRQRVHLWERDCSTQRRHQKLIEESPAPNLPEEVRQAMCEAAVRLVRQAELHQCRHRRVHRRQGQQLLLHRSQCPDSGRASGHRNGDRHRSDQGADCDRGRRAVALVASGDPVRAAWPWSAASTPRTSGRTSSPAPERSSG